jgi:hypothetical protein
MSGNMGKADLRIDWATHAAAKYACETWHYSRCLPAGKLVKVGAWERGRFIGVVLFGRGTAALLGNPYGLNQTECVELVRVALTKHKNQVSRIVAISLRFLKSISPGLRLVVSFASQDEGHHGGIYQAGGWVYAGTTHPKTEYLLKGKRATDRQISQMVKETRIRRAEMVSRGILIPLPTTPKHRYLMPLDDEIRARVLPLSKPYPKRQPVGGSGDQPDERPCESDPGAPSSEKPDAAT